MKLACERCGACVDEEDSYELGNERVCEDCYFDSTMPHGPCDPVSQSGVDKFSEAYGEVKPEDLLETQRDVYEFIGTRQKTPLLAAGMNAALLLVSVMFHSLDVSLNRFAAHFSSGSDIVTS